MLELQAITKDYRSVTECVHALRGVSLRFRDNEFVSILGPSGCGKTTLLNIIGGLDRYTAGDLLMAGSQQSNQIFIVTADYDRMAEAILHEADRGVTLIDATGGYSRHEIRIVMVVCYKRDAGHVLRIARDVDPKAFVTIASVSGTYGEGFRKLTQLR